MFGSIFLGVEESDLMKKQCYVLDTLTSMLNFSSENLLTQEMFDALMHPLLKQVRVNFKMLSKKRFAILAVKVRQLL